VDRLEEGRTALREAVTGFDAADLEQDELDRIRSARVGRLMMRRLSSMGQAYYLAMAELDGDLGEYLRALTAYDALTTADLQRVASRYLAGMNLVEVVVD
jgi:predicted Zn-dependent peptidase